MLLLAHFALPLASNHSHVLFPASVTRPPLRDPSLGSRSLRQRRDLPKPGGPLRARHRCCRRRLCAHITSAPRVTTLCGGCCCSDVITDGIISSSHAQFRLLLVFFRSPPQLRVDIANFAQSSACVPTGKTLCFPRNTFRLLVLRSPPPNPPPRRRPPSADPILRQLTRPCGFCRSVSVPL